MQPTCATQPVYTTALHNLQWVYFASIRVHEKKSARISACYEFTAHSDNAVWLYFRHCAELSSMEIQRLGWLVLMLVNLYECRIDVMFGHQCIHEVPKSQDVSQSYCSSCISCCLSNVCQFCYFYFGVLRVMPHVILKRDSEIVRCQKLEILYSHCIYMNQVLTSYEYFPIGSNHWLLWSGVSQKHYYEFLVCSLYPLLISQDVFIILA